jgi:hypothetical protein
VVRAANAVCPIDDAKKIVAMAGQAQVNRNAVVAWRSARSVKVVPVKICAQRRGQVQQALARSQKVRVVQQVIASNPRLLAQLGKYRASNVFAAQQNGGQLTVYVY